MTLTGGGELLLASSNSYSGPTTVSGAFLQLDNAGALTTGNLLIDGGVIGAGDGELHARRRHGRGPGPLQLQRRRVRCRQRELRGESRRLVGDDDLGFDVLPAQQRLGQRFDERDLGPRLAVVGGHSGLPEPDQPRRDDSDRASKHRRGHRRRRCQAQRRDQRQRRPDRDGRRRAGANGFQHVQRRHDSGRRRALRAERGGPRQRRRGPRRRHAATGRSRGTLWVRQQRRIALDRFDDRTSAARRPARWATSPPAAIRST